MSDGDDIQDLKKRIQAARGQIPCDLVLKKGRVINVFSGEILEADVAIHQGVIVGVGAGYRGEEEVEMEGRFISPGLMDGHIHIESTMLIPSRLADCLLVRGTTAIVADPHEIANVMGIEGIRFMLRDSENLPVDIFFMAPSCVPATHLETSGAALGHEALSPLLREPRVLGLAEMMNFPGVLAGDESVIAKLLLFRDRVIDGHAPFLLGRDLQAYCCAGPGSDHESSELPEAFEKLQAGMRVMIREGTSAKNLEKLAPLVTERNSRRLCLVTDDLHPEDLTEKGHLDHLLRKAVGSGVDPLIALQMVTLNPAEYFGLRGRGAIAPGFRADLVVFNDLKDFSVDRVYKDGRLWVREGELLESPERKDANLPHWPMRVSSLSPESFRIAKQGRSARIIEVIPGQILTKTRIEEIPSGREGVLSDVDKDILKLVVVERHKETGRIGLGLVHGFGLKRGALASSVAHDSHNLIAVGVEDLDLFVAIEAVRRMGGGLVAAQDGKILAQVCLGIAGLMSGDSISTLVPQVKAVGRAAESLGCVLSAPFMTLSFLALPVIPELKLTDRGLVDVRLFSEVPLFV